MKSDKCAIAILALLCVATFAFQGCAASKGNASGDDIARWKEIKAQVDVHKNAKEYPAAMNLLNGVDATLLRNPSIKADVEAKRAEVIEHGKAAVIKDRAAAERLIDEVNFHDARKLIDRMKAIYTDTVFSGENSWVAEAPRLLDTKFETAERDGRPWLLRQVTSRTTNAMLQSQIGVGFGKYGSFNIDYSGQNLCYHFNPDKKIVSASYGAGINFAIPGGAKDISDFRTLSFFFHVDGGWDAEIRVTIDCGAGGSYQCVRNSAISGGYFSIRLHPSEWVMMRAPNTANDKPFQVVTSVRIAVSLKTRDGMPTQNDTFFEINSVEFMK